MSLLFHYTPKCVYLACQISHPVPIPLQHPRATPCFHFTCLHITRSLLCITFINNLFYTIACQSIAHETLIATERFRPVSTDTLRELIQHNESVHGSYTSPPVQCSSFTWAALSFPLQLISLWVRVYSVSRTFCNTTRLL